MKVAPPSAAEQLKASSRFLRGTVSEELRNSEELFSKPATGVLKFHGIYQQDDRDLRKQGKKQYTAMVRVGIPGGALTPDQYLALDRLAVELADGSLRLTTRQDIQYHYVGKRDLPKLIKTINDNLLSTLAACGDVVRNVTASCIPFDTPQRKELEPIIRMISRSLKPKTSGYYEIWVNGEKAVSAEAEEEVEPLYGATYLPRKFKIGFAFPGDNTTDIYSNDIGIVPSYQDGKLEGFTILAGGGMGQSAGVKASHPRLADPICFISSDPEELLNVCKAIVTIHRDFGNRSNRKLARLKYVLDEWGVEKFKQELESRVGYSLAAPKLLDWDVVDDLLGWHRQGTDANGNELWFVGVRIISGRIRDFADRPILTGLRKIIQQYRPSIHVTSQQNLYLSDIKASDKLAISTLLREHGLVEPEALPPVLRLAMSCPALPTCGQAITESERIMPEVVANIQKELDALGLDKQPIHLRTTGCPNGCARPYTAEIGIVGASVAMYTIYLGASPLGTRLGSMFAQNVKQDQLTSRLRPVFEHYKENRQPEEAFGDFCHRIGIPALQQLSTKTEELVHS